MHGWNFLYRNIFSYTSHSPQKGSQEPGLITRMWPGSGLHFSSKTHQGRNWMLYIDIIMSRMMMSFFCKVLHPHSNLLAATCRVGNLTMWCHFLCSKANTIHYTQLIALHSDLLEKEGCITLFETVRPNSSPGLSPQSRTAPSCFLIHMPALFLLSSLLASFFCWQTTALHIHSHSPHHGHNLKNVKPINTMVAALATFSPHTIM